MCVYVQMVKRRELCYYLTLSVTDQGRLTQCYPLPAHVLLLPLLMLTSCGKSNLCRRVFSLQDDELHPLKKLRMFVYCRSAGSQAMMAHLFN